MTLKRFSSIFVFLALLGLALPGAADAHGGRGGSGGGFGGSGGGAGGGTHYSGNYSGHYSGTTSGNYVHSGNSNYVRSGNVNFAGNSLHHNSNWSNSAYHNNWNHYYHGGYWGGWWRGGWYGGYPLGFWLGWGYPYWWDGYWAGYFCPYGPYYATAYPAGDYMYSYADDSQQYALPPPGQYTVNAPPVADAAGQPPDDQGTAEAMQYYNEARAAFEQGKYRDALRLASHAGVESPQNSKVHELVSLALFAQGDYRGAATEAHAALALGPPSTWNDLFAYYGNAETYTQQLRKLENTVSTVPKSGAGQFLLGYHYLMTGATAEAKEHFALAAKLTPNDKLAQHILKQLDSGGAVTPPELPKPPTEPAAGQSL